jgi:hypothetical protein
MKRAFVFYGSLDPILVRHSNLQKEESPTEAGLSILIVNVFHALEARTLRSLFRHSKWAA